MKIYLLFITLIAITLFGCCEPHFNQCDFIGKWTSSDSSSINLYSDGTCRLNNINYIKINSIESKKGDKLNSSGVWKLIYEFESGIPNGISTGVGISYRLPNRAGTGGLDFFISGEGILENKPPYYLFIWDGDPDNVEKYKFVKE